MFREKHAVIIVAAGSDIGAYLASHYIQRGFRVYGTYRSITPELANLRRAGVNLIQLDITSDNAISNFVAALRQEDVFWDVLISAPGILSPIGHFFDLDFDEWERSVCINSLSQLKVLRAIYPLRTKQKVAKCVFFAGGGTNGSFDNYSAYCVGKLVLIKMVELLDSEYPDLQVSTIGTGWVNTKIHQQTLVAGLAAGENLRKTRDFIESNQTQGVSLKTVAECIDWCLNSPRSAVGGRNFSLVFDNWRDESFIDQLQKSSDTYKLRRFV